MPGAARFTDEISHGGFIVEGSPDMIVNGLPQARLFDKVICKKHGKQKIVTASFDTIVDGRGAARLGDKISCGAFIITASFDTLVN